MKIEIEVTQDDIDKGETNHSCKCPIARAINRVCPKASVGTYYCYLYEEPGKYGSYGGIQVEMPYVFKQFVNDFDCGKPVQPFKHTIYLDEEQTQRFEYIKQERMNAIPS